MGWVRITESRDSRAVSTNLTAVIFQVGTSVQGITQIITLTIHRTTKLSLLALVRITESVGLATPRIPRRVITVKVVGVAPATTNLATTISLGSLAALDPLIIGMASRSARVLITV